MTLRYDCFFIVLYLLCFFGSCHAIYDPSVTTVKPPQRREPVLPWYVAGKDYPVPTEDADVSRSPKWPTNPDEPRKPLVIDSDPKAWTPWRKASESEIEQRTGVGGHSPQTNLDQKRDWFLEYDQFEQREKSKYPRKPSTSESLGQEQQVYPIGDKFFENKDHGSGRNQESDWDLYEGLSEDTQKSRKEKILLSAKPKSTIARYDHHRGVVCPELDSTGQFVYPPDCKFFVNCWKGRAFVQPCAPGTLFNPETLECDFPHKVKCYGGEIAEFPLSEHLESSGRREPLFSASQVYSNKERLETSHEPRCPPHVTGLLPHPTDCTKFLQCAHGGMHIMDCGPGTVFNPAVSVCDWPRNVRGCEGAYKTAEEDSAPHVPPNHYDRRNSEYNNHQNQHTIKCPPDYSGLLPHPETCKKFLQCANGITYVMDCGPGTAFNPLTSVCDWPYNVPGCNNDKSSTTTRPWPSRDQIGSTPWQSPHRHNQTSHGHNGPVPWHSGHPSVTTTTSTPTIDWDSRLRPTWRPTWKPDMWTTARPSYDRGNYNYSKPGNANYPPQYGHGVSDSRDRQNFGRDYPHHHQQHHAHGQVYNSNINPGMGQNVPHDQRYPYRPDGDYDQETTQERLPPHPSYPWNYPGQRPGTDRNQFNYPLNRTGTRLPEGNLPPNRRLGYDFTPNRQEYGRDGFGPSRPGYDRTPAPDGNIYVDSDYDSDEDGNPSPIGGVWSSNTNRTLLIWPTRNRTDTGKSEIPGRGIGFNPSGWNIPQGQGHMQPPTQAQPRPWNQGGINQGDKLDTSESGTNFYPQSTADSEVDRKLEQWASKTNIIQHAKGQVRPGIKETNLAKPDYQNGVFVNVNGTRGHFITKEIEVNQGHSNTRNYGSNRFPDPTIINNTSQGFQPRNDSRTNRAHNFSRGQPATELQPPIYSPIHHPYEPTINFTGTKPNQLPIYHSLNRPPAAPVPADSLGSHSTPNHHVLPPPVTMQQPPYFQPEYSAGSQFPGSTNLNAYHPNVPATGLQPPYYGPPPNRNNFYPSVPATELQPPYYGPYPEVPASGLQPPFYEGPSPSFTPVDPPYVNVQVPNVPSQDLLPPYYESPELQFGNPNPVFDSKNLTHTSNSPRNDNITTTASTLANKTAVYKPNKQQEAAVKKKALQSKPKIHGSTKLVDPNVPTVSIENGENSEDAEDKGNVSDAQDVVEPDLNVDVLDDKQVWKPVLVFENKTVTTTTTESSVIMRINKKSTDVDLFNIEAAPFQEEEPSFPTYYVPPVHPISHSRKTAQLTPISGQVIRLRGGAGPSEGYVEVQGTNPGWGIVCDARNSWTLKEAHIVCRQLGYARGAEMAWQGRNTRDGVPTWIAANTVTCHGNETRFQLCKFSHHQECRVERDAIGVRCVPNSKALCRQDEIAHEGQCYHFAKRESNLNYEQALQYCIQKQGRLLDITNQLENDFISEWVIQKHPDVTSILTSGVGFTTFNHTIWLWEDSSRAKFSFSKWWPGWKGESKNPPTVSSRHPVCVVMKRKFSCHERSDSMCFADYFFWDTVDCEATTKDHSYICKRPYDNIGCVYGKGSQYSGTANITTSGNRCLPWADPKVAHSLVVNVVNREYREKLKTHNYCRNPNSQRESRPWCFAEPKGEREYCDIPSCGNINGNIASKKSLLTGQCKPKHFECLPGECIPSPWVCDGDEDCTNGADERNCRSHLSLFQKSARHRLDGYDVEKWLNTPLKTCALRCKEADFTCRSFAHKAAGNICLLSDSNIGMTGALKPDKEFDYYEMKERSMNCDGLFVCGNRKCINQTDVCNGKNDCNDRSDENICTVENLDYDIRLAGSNEKHEGRVEVKILGVWGQVCDDGFGIIAAEVICKELGFTLGALEVRPGGFYGNLEPPTRFMVDQLKCRGNETSLRECDFDGWGVHNCQPEEAVGIVCKTAVDSCQEGQWKCDRSPTCIPTPFICDEVVDCPDGSDESSEHCEAPFEVRLANGSSPMEGRVEVRHHGVWGTVCDDDFSNTNALVVCRSLGYGGRAIVKKDGHFGPGQGPIWLDEVFCHGNETQLSRCEHNHWGQHNCDHNEDAGVICSPGDVNDSEFWELVPNLPEPDINDLLPANCGRRSKDFNDDEDRIFAKVVHGTIAPKGTYPWQASIRVRGHSRSSHWCGAVVISPLHVLTAAHCLEGYVKGTYFVRAGDYNTEINEGTEAEANIEDYYIHEDFRKGHRMNNDIALVLLKGQGIPLGKDIMPICLPPENIEYPVGLNCSISGFGSIETGKSSHSKDLRYGWVPLLDQSVCRAGYIYGEGAISDGMVCAGYLDEGVDTCDGDSGGPLACYRNGAFTLYGITSWGQHCGKANKPGVYVRVSYYRRWIDQKIKESLAGR